ncbi:possible membrane protein [Streptomyces venezuelae ATCC 10712]|uniref:Possible membrane protein n=1 Tax=Streptomyces venezuelae (strain ATCC 10712 / CBS 650.69 / DSM 40230 / JCM 4526 / NBRC 13096 / PD 04745) TaxID=953739 RepID=F2R529_STRVP|nr:possible membrane protein [Streptomyces venezuelae ATCC 10712]
MGAVSGLVTGDAVVLGLQPARLPSRALAVLIDLVVVWAAYLLITLGLAVATASLDEAAETAVFIASFLLLLVGVPIAVETLSHGRSLGKLACGLRVVRDDGGPIRFRHALVRGAMGVVEILMTFGVVACVASLVSERGRRLGDVFAGTLVVRERIPAARVLAVPPPPPWLVGRFAGLDLSAVPEALWLEIRQYLTRARELDPAVGRRLAERLADELVARTGTPPPPGVPADAYLAGVVAERQARDSRRALAPASGMTAPVAGMTPPVSGMTAPAPGMTVPGAGPASASFVPPAATPAASPVPPPVATGDRPQSPAAPAAPSTGFAPPA